MTDLTPGQRLKEIMDKVGVKQPELAALADTSKVSIWRMVHDQQDITFEVLKVLRQRYKVNINSFFSPKR